MREVIASTKAPAALGPYSQAIAVDGVVYTSGVIGVDPQTGAAGETIQEQTEQALQNLREVLRAAGTDLSAIVKTTVFIKNMDDFAKVNEIYAAYMEEPYPARSCVEVARLPKDLLVEIEAIALR